MKKDVKIYDSTRKITGKVLSKKGKVYKVQTKEHGIEYWEGEDVWVLTN